MIHAYARVSTTDQTTRLQLDAIARVRPDRVWEECGSGADVTRPQLAAMLQALQPGDEVIVWKLDRLVRSLRHLLVIVDTITTAGASLRSLTEPIDTASALGRMMLQLLGSFAEFERGMILERASAGREAAVLRGVKFGRPRTVDWSCLDALVSEGLTHAQIARAVGCDRSYVGKWIRRQRKASGPLPSAHPGVNPAVLTPNEGSGCLKTGRGQGQILDGAEAARGAQPKASTERVSTGQELGEAEPLTPGRLRGASPQCSRQGRGMKERSGSIPRACRAASTY